MLLFEISSTKSQSPAKTRTSLIRNPTRRNTPNQKDWELVLALFFFAGKNQSFLSMILSRVSTGIPLFFGSRFDVTDEALP